MTLGKARRSRHRHAGAARKRSLASGTRPAPSPLHHLLFDAQARDSPALCMGPVPSAHGALRRRPARDDVGGRRAALATVMPAPLASEALRAGPGRHPVHFTTCSSMRRRATVRRCAWVPCLRPTARCAVGLRGMTLGKARRLSPTSCRRRSQAKRASRTRPAPSPLPPLALRCACARQSGAVHGSRAFGPRRLAP